ncbi:MAG: DUF2058 domain-containing protein [Candidatus Hydrogenedentes bacterium]|nr:DUF2058 domain-containing protein [Candidatus Hydrogenedentota bacterium]
MNNAFRDQLLKAGLTTKKKAKAAAHEENVSSRKRRRKKKGGAEVTEGSSDSSAAQAALAAKRDRDKALNQERDAERHSEALEAEVDDLIAKNRLRDTRGDIGYKFSDGGTIKTILVTAEVQRALSDGVMGIAWGKDGYSLVPHDVALRIEERVPNRLVLLNDSVAPDGDDPYAEYTVPDDLMW